MDVSVCSIAQTEVPSLCNFFTTSSADSACSQETFSVAPRAVLWMSLWGGQAVIPQRYIFFTKKASEERKTEPMLCKLRILSKIKVKGNFSAALNSSTDFRISSTFLSLRITL